MSASTPPPPAMDWFRYHEATKHSVASLRRAPHTLDWANMPDPFRHYDGAPVIDLPAAAPAPVTPALDILLGEPGQPLCGDGATFLSALLFHSAAVSATKVVPASGYRYALRVNPSSGNLHPTEFHFAARGLRGWPRGLYHYRPSEHTAGQRAAGGAWPLVAAESPLSFLLTSIAWREAWKYRDRAYRYSLLDMGHAWQALALAAAALGCRAHAVGAFDDAAIAAACRVAPDEWPLLAVSIDGPGLPADDGELQQAVWTPGTPNALSPGMVPYPLIDAIHAATSQAGGGGIFEPPPAAPTDIALPAPARTTLPFAEAVRRRRSALDFHAVAPPLELAGLAALLAAAGQPMPADFGGGYLELYIYAHNVAGLAPGVYRHLPGAPALELVKAGNQRVAAAGLSLGQELAGNALVAFSMVAGVPRAARAFGDRAYRYAHFAAGATGQRLYVAAEAFGLRATGIGAFFDDRVHDYLGIDARERQVVYHFAIGHPVHDPRLDG